LVTFEVQHSELLNIPQCFMTAFLGEVYTNS